MALVRAPSTPTSQLSQAAASSPSPGTWRHPKLDEISKRQNAAIFGQNNLRRILWNGGALCALWYASSLFKSHSELRNAFLPVATQQYTYYLFNVLCLLSIFNIVVSCYPLVRKKDNLTDIALTPSQRALLGLDPDETPPVTPSTRYITPPRYSRSITPRKNSSGNWSGSNNPSPTSRNASPSLGLERIGLPFSPLTSLNWQKAIGGSRNVANRDSYGSPSPIGIGRSLKDTSVLGVPSTPSPSGGKGSSVGLNSRWLYERGRASPGSRMPKIYS